MAKLGNLLPKPDGVSAGGTATFRIPTGRRIHSLQFQYNGVDQAISDFTEFRLYINGKEFQRFSGIERDKLNQFDKAPAANGVLKIPFDRKDCITKAGRETTALNTGVEDSNGNKISSMYMEVDILAGATIAGSDLTLYAKESDAVFYTMGANGVKTKAGAGVIPYLRKEQRTVSGADTDYQISDLVNPGVNAPDKIALDRITFVPNANTISNLIIFRNQYNIFDRPDALNRFMQNDGIKAPVAGFFTIDTKEDGLGGETIDLTGMTDYRYRLACSGAMTLTCLSEYFGALQN